ncbi:MAG: glycosyltransferase [Pirellulales bacterium]
MNAAALFFWACVLLVLYTYVLYPLAIWLLARVFPQRTSTGQSLPSAVSFVVAARAEGERVAERAEELKQQLDAASLCGEVIVVLDGPGTPEHVVQRMIGRDIQVHALPERCGKAAAISAGAKLAQHQILALADVRQRWQPDALGYLIESFRDARIGAVSGDLVLEPSPGVTAGVGLYWRYEKWLRRNEAEFDSVVGLTGAICAVRRNLFHGIPAGTVLDDVYWPLQVVMQGYRVGHNARARAFDRLPDNARDEFRRKVRTLSGNFQLVTRLPALLLPWKNRLWWQFLSHKLMRLVVPWLLLIALVTSAMVPTALFIVLFWCQLAFYTLNLLLLATGSAGHHRLTAAAASFVVLNLAALVAFWVWISGSLEKNWGVVRYDGAAGGGTAGADGHAGRLCSITEKETP